MSTATPTVRSLDSRIDDLERGFVGFQARMDTVVSLLKWIGAFVLATLVAVIVQLFSISFGAGRLMEKVDAQATAVHEMNTELRSQGTALQELKTELRKTQEKIDNQGAILQELKTEFREFRKELGQLREELQKRK